MKNYYFVLGLNIYSRDVEIKQAYRKLVLQYHPDRNPARNAESIIKEINEAYEVLSDPQRKLLYDQMLVGGEPELKLVRQPHRDPKYRPQRPDFVSKQPSKRKVYFDFMQSNLSRALLVSRLTLLFSCILVADFTLPQQHQSKAIVSKEGRSGRYDTSIKFKVEGGATFSLGKKSFGEFERGSIVTLYSSPLLSVPISVENEQTEFQDEIRISIYGNFIFVPLILLITSLLGTFYQKGIEFRFNLGVINFMLVFINFLVLRIHNF